MPSIRTFQDFSIGVHCTQINRALSPMAIFIEMIMNQTTTFIHPSVNRSRVSAKLVLDQMAAVSENVPERLMTLRRSKMEGSSSGGKSQM